MLAILQNYNSVFKEDKSLLSYRDFSSYYAEKCIMFKNMSTVRDNLRLLMLEAMRIYGGKKK